MRLQILSVGSDWSAKNMAQASANSLYGMLVYPSMAKKALSASAVPASGVAKQIFLNRFYNMRLSFT